MHMRTVTGLSAEAPFLPEKGFFMSDNRSDSTETA